MSNSRDRTYLLKLSDAERDDLERRAAEKDVTRADLIREALGWDTVPSAPTDRKAAPRKSSTRPRAKATSSPPREEPGVAGLSELTRRIAARRGA